jgi:hypothetical protein
VRDSDLDLRKCLDRETRLARSTYQDDHLNCDCHTARSSELSDMEIVPDLSGSERAAESRSGSCRPNSKRTSGARDQ